MEVKLKVTKWAIKTDDEKKTKQIVGNYEISSGATVIAKQEFNDGYSAISLPFSTKLMAKLEEVEKEIEQEIQAHIS